LIEIHDACVKCGYSLFGHPQQGTCPECWTRFEKPIHSETACHPPYRASVAISAINIGIILFVFLGPRPMPDILELGGLILAWVLSLCALACAIIKRLGTRRYNLTHAMLALALSIVILAFLSFILAIAALFLITGGA